MSDYGTGRPSPTPSPSPGPAPHAPAPTPTPSPTSGAAPTPPGGPTGPGGSSGEVKADPTTIRQHGRDLVEKVSPHLEKARTGLENNPAEEFSEDGIAMTSVYPGIKDFFVKSLESKVKAIEKLRDDLDRTAETWERADQKSSVQEV